MIEYCYSIKEMALNLNEFDPKIYFECKVSPYWAIEKAKEIAEDYYYNHGGDMADWPITFYLWPKSSFFHKNKICPNCQKPIEIILESEGESWSFVCRKCGLSITAIREVRISCSMVPIFDVAKINKEADKFNW